MLTINFILFSQVLPISMRRHIKQVCSTHRYVADTQVYIKQVCCCGFIANNTFSHSCTTVFLLVSMPLAHRPAWIGHVNSFSSLLTTYHTCLPHHQPHNSAISHNKKEKSSRIQAGHADGAPRTAMAVSVAHRARAYFVCCMCERQAYT